MDNINSIDNLGLSESLHFNIMNIFVFYYLWFNFKIYTSKLIYFEI